MSLLCTILHWNLDAIFKREFKQGPPFSSILQKQSMVSTESLPIYTAWNGNGIRPTELILKASLSASACKITCAHLPDSFPPVWKSTSGLPWWQWKFILFNEWKPHENHLCNFIQQIKLAQQGNQLEVSVCVWITDCQSCIVLLNRICCTQGLPSWWCDYKT